MAARDRKARASPSIQNRKQEKTAAATAATAGSR
jgi:hypothetical protein